MGTGTGVQFFIPWTKKIPLEFLIRDPIQDPCNILSFVRHCFPQIFEKSKNEKWNVSVRGNGVCAMKLKLKFPKLFEELSFRKRICFWRTASSLITFCFLPCDVTPYNIDRSQNKHCPTFHSLFSCQCVRWRHNLYIVILLYHSTLFYTTYKTLSSSTTYSPTLSSY